MSDFFFISEFSFKIRKYKSSIDFDRIQIYFIDIFYRANVSEFDFTDNVFVAIDRCSHR